MFKEKLYNILKIRMCMYKRMQSRNNVDIENEVLNLNMLIIIQNRNYYIKINKLRNRNLSLFKMQRQLVTY